MLTPGEGVLIDVAAAGVSFPTFCKRAGSTSSNPTFPFIPGRGGRRHGHLRRPPAAACKQGDRVMAFTVLGGMAERAVAPAYLTFPLPEQLDFAQGRR